MLKHSPEQICSVPLNELQRNDGIAPLILSHLAITLCNDSDSKGAGIWYGLTVGCTVSAVYFEFPLELHARS
jgi:hypothetical protein